MLLAAWPGEDTLAAYPLMLVDQAIRAHAGGALVLERMGLTPHT